MRALTCCENLAAKDDLMWRAKDEKLLEAVLRRLLFQFKYMPTREVMKQRLGAEHHEKSSTVMQGTMIWFLINTVVRFCQISVVF